MGVIIRVYNDKNLIYNNTSSDLFLIIRNISLIVDKAADTAYNRSALITTRPKQREWGDTIDDYFAGKNVLFMNAAYGYAVEDIANIAIASTYRFAVKGYRVYLQERRGSTIPDIVIKNSANEDQAWLDITSEHSAGHIFNKSGSGWSTTDFVAELLYPNLDLINIRNSDDDSIGARAHALSAIRRYAVFQNKVHEYFETTFSNALNGLKTPKILNLPTIAKAVEAAFRVDFPENKKHSAIKSMLQMFIDCQKHSINSDFSRYLLSEFYTSKSQDKSFANDYITYSYEQYCKQNPACLI